MDSRPLIVHMIHSFETGGLENGLVNLINHLPPERYRHHVVALTRVSEFRHRISRTDVECMALDKPPGHGVQLYPRVLRLLRSLRPAIVHTRNLAALEMQVPAWLAGVPVRIHGEHGRDANDLHGANRRYRVLRRAYAPFVDHYVALSRDLSDYLRDGVGISSSRIEQIFNGVDVERFHPASEARESIPGCPFQDPSLWLVGTVGRMLTVKSQPTLARAFVQMLQEHPEQAPRVRLLMIGDGPLRTEALAVLRSAGVDRLAWLPGERTDVPAVMRGLDCFVLPSLAEGISNTILEAMASGLPVVATRVGGNADLVVEGVTGELVTAGDAAALARSLAGLCADPDRAAAFGRAGRQVADQRFGLATMVRAYESLYDRSLAGRLAESRPSARHV